LKSPRDIVFVHLKVQSYRIKYCRFFSKAAGTNTGDIKIMFIHDLIIKSLDNDSFSSEELVFLLSHPPNSPEALKIMAEAAAISRKFVSGRAEVHGQLALDLAPCACDCKFCSFAKVNEIFSTETRITPEQAVYYARQHEDNGANAVYVMTTAQYPFGRFIEISQEIRKNLDPQTIMVANVGDQSLDRARKIKDAGYAGVYHALRMREGIDTRIPPEKRLESMRNFQEAGLKVGTCVEPVGPEHTNEEIAQAIYFAASINPVFSGAARRIEIPGTEIAKRGMISELRMAQIVAVIILGTPRSVKGFCTHEPCTLGALAGANLLWAEAGSNPRDTREKTEQGPGLGVEACRNIYRECEWDVLEGPSSYFKVQHCT
jgi:biotin synthase